MKTHSKLYKLPSPWERGWGRGLVALCLLILTATSCEPEENGTPIPSTYSITYYMEVNDGSDTKVYQGVSPKTDGILYTELKDDDRTYALLGVEFRLDNSTGDNISARVYADADKRLIPLGQSYKPGGDISDIVMTVDGKELEQEGDGGTHSISNLQYYTTGGSWSFTGKATFRYDFSDVVLYGTTPNEYTAKGHIIVAVVE